VHTKYRRVLKLRTKLKRIVVVRDISIDSFMQGIVTNI